jgi:hypothetical protein
MRSARRTAAAVVSGLLTAGVTAALPITAAFADGQVTGVQPSTVDSRNAPPITFTTTDQWTALRPPQVTITRTSDATHNDSIDGSGESVSSTDSHKVTANFDLNTANPGTYNVTITGFTPSAPTGTTDTCTGCLTIRRGAPTISSITGFNSVMAGNSYPNWGINGDNFTKGPYVQCTSLPCDPTKPTVAIFNGAVLDPDVSLSPADIDSATRFIPLVLTVDRSNAGGARTIQVTNTDGQVATCTNCLTIAPAMSVTSVVPDHLPAGSRGQTLTINGANFPSDVTAKFERASDRSKTGDVAWTSTSVTSTQITQSNVSVTSNAPEGNEWVELHSESIHGSNAWQGLFAIGGTAPVAQSPEAAPTNVTASGGDQEAFVQWTPPVSTDADPITGYVVRTLPNGDPSTPAPASASSATVGPLTNGQSYQFTVTVTYKSGTSWTSSASNPATPSGRPDAPTNVQAAAGNKSATVTWTAPPAPDGSPVDRYTVTASPDGVQANVFAQGSSAPPTSVVVSGLKNGTTYTFTVVAHNKSGNSDDSDPSNAVTPKGVATLTLHGPKTLAKGDATTLRGQLLDSSGKPVAGAKIKLQQRHSGAHQFGTLKLLTTTKKGHWSYEVRPKTTTRYRVRWAGNAGNDPVATSRTVTVRETGAITSPKDGAKVSAGKVTVRGHVTSAKGFPVALQERRGGKWVTIAKGTVGAHHKVSLQTTLTRGTAKLRLQVSGELGTETGYSAPVTVTVT